MFEHFTIRGIVWEWNHITNALAKLAITKEMDLEGSVYLEICA